MAALEIRLQLGKGRSLQHVEPQGLETITGIEIIVNGREPRLEERDDTAWIAPRHGGAGANREHLAIDAKQQQFKQLAAFADLQSDFQGQNREDETLADFVDQMSARFGPDLLSMPVLFQSHVPERAGRLLPVADVAQGDGDSSFYQGSADQGTARPLRLFAHPEPVETTAEIPDGPPHSFRWRRTLFRVARAEGPERIAAEWWIDGEDAPARDYFRIEDEAGRRYWLYREGLYERGAGTPRWFIQGVFA
jgi:hypothetical protein